VKSKGLSIVLIICFISLFLSTAGFGFELLEPFGYAWINGGYHRTNAEREDFDSALGRVEAKIGLAILPLWNNAALQAYLAYYGVYSEEPHSWNNNDVSGVGIQVMPLLGMNDLGWLQDLTVFYEELSINWTNSDEDDINDNTDYLEETDTRFGVELWHEWNQPSTHKVENRDMLWAELWTSLSYRETNFGYEEFEDFVFFFQPKIGMYSFVFFKNISLEPYFKVDLVSSGKEYPYYNNVAPGIGLRIRPFVSGYVGGQKMTALRKLKFFVEILQVSYLKERGPVDYDFRIGIDLNIGR